MATAHTRTLAMARCLIRLAAPLVPARIRNDWRREWDGELASLDPSARPTAMRHALGAFVDAFWLRQRQVADFDVIDDLRHGWRQLTSHAGFAATAVGILALGMAAAVTMFSVTDQVLLRPLPYPQPERIVTLWETKDDTAELLEVSPGNFLDWRERARAFEQLAGVDPWSLDYIGGSRPEVFFAAKVTQGFFESFGVRPALGRFFAPEEYQEGRDKVLVLSEAFWRQRFGGDPAVVGRALAFEDGPHVVVGIVPGEFEPRLLPTATGHRDVWSPKVIQEYEPRSRSSGYWSVVGRLKEGVSREAAQAELDTVARQLAVEYPRTNEGSGGRVVPLREHLVGNVRLAVGLLSAAVALVLLIACVNVLSLMLARGALREREIAIRMALGARRGRLARQLLTESVLVAALGGIVGTMLTHWALQGLARLGPRSVPWIETLHLDGRAVAFAAALIVAVAMLAGALPAWRATVTALASAGRATSTAGPASHRLRAGLVVAEIALALMLVCGAGLLIRSFAGLINVDPGFQRGQVMVLQVFAFDHNPTPAQLRTFFDRCVDRLRALPSVQSVGLISAMPFIESNINIQSDIEILGRPAPAVGEAPRAYLNVADPGYFEAMRVPLKRGRLLDDRDGPESRLVAVISEDLAGRYWRADEDPIGDRIRAQFRGRAGEVEVVGIVASLRHDALDRAPRAEIFFSSAQVPTGAITFVVRTAGDPASIIDAAKAEIWAVNPEQTIYRTATLDELVAKTLSPRRFALAALIAFAGVALLLAAGGIYGVLSTVAAASVREIGVRMALGASAWDILRWVLARGFTIAGLGIVVGLAGTLGAGQLLRGFLFEVAPTDPATIITASLVMLIAATAACVAPARGAMNANPVEVLRAE